MDGVKPVRRIICIDNAEGKSEAIADGPAPDVRTDPARPGFASTRIWVTDATPARMKGIRDTVHMPHTLEPPASGSVCRIVTFPPDAVFRGKSVRVRGGPISAHGSPKASTYDRRRRTPTCKRTHADLSGARGEITLVLDERKCICKRRHVIQRGPSRLVPRSDAPAIASRARGAFCQTATTR